MDETDSKNEELKSDLHGNSKVKVPLFEKPDCSAPDREAGRDAIGVSSDPDRCGVDKNSESATRDFQGLNSIQEYASKIRAFIGLEDDSALSPVVSPGSVGNNEPDDPLETLTELGDNESDFPNGENKYVSIGDRLDDQLSPVVSPGSVGNNEPDDPLETLTELGDNESDFPNGENKHVSIGDRLDDLPGIFSETNKNKRDFTTDGNGNETLDTEPDHSTGIFSDNDKNAYDLATDDNDTCVGSGLDDKSGTCSVVDKTLSDVTLNDNLRSIDKGLDDQKDIFFKIDENSSNLTLERIDITEDEINNNEDITCDISIKSNDSQRLEENYKNSLSEIDETINESDSSEIKDVCETLNNVLNSSENSNDIVVDQTPKNDENERVVSKSCLKMSDYNVNLIGTDTSFSDGIDLNDSQAIVLDELADNDNLVKGLGISSEVVEKKIYSSDLKDDDMRGEFFHTNGENNYASVNKEELDSQVLIGDENQVETGRFSVCLIETDDGQEPSIEHLRRLSSEIVNRVLDSAENQLKDILEESQKETIDTNILALYDKASEINKITSPFNGASEINKITSPFNDSSETIPMKMAVNNSSKESNITKETNNKPIKEINLKDVLSKTYDSKDFTKKIEIEMNKFQPEYDVDPDTICGIGSFKPQWLQPWATAKVYLVLYSIIGILSGSYYSYLISSISTLEKRFAFKSKVSGSIMMVDEITPLLLGVLIGYFGGRTHRPRMVAFGMLLSSICCFVSALPYFIYGAATHLHSVSIQNTTKFESCESAVQLEDCDSDDRPPTMAAVLFLMLGSFLKGFGNLAYFAVGLTYMDDNAKKKNTPMYFAVAFALRLLGPLVGFLMSSAFLKFYENPFVDPGFGPEDPRWIGGWWMGFVLQGILLSIFSAPLALFPRRLPGHKVTRPSSKQEGDSEVSNVAGLLAALKRLGKNPLFVFITLNTIMSVYGSFGHYIMLPKYMENQFRLSASQASLLSGPPGIAALIVSTLIGGYMIYRFRPSAKILTGGMAILAVVDALGFLLLMIPQCENIQMSNYGWDGEGLILDGGCNSNCSCSTKAFTPVCAPDGKTHYFSPCFAACQDKTNGTFTGCSCVEETFGQSYVTEGFCVIHGCWSQALAYIITLPIISFIVSVLRVAHTMILLRSMETDDKSVALGTFEAFLSAFGFIPYPVVFGALIDSACLIFEKSCGKTGNCWFYDVDKFNYLLHGSSALFSALSAICLFVVFCLSGRVNDLYEEDEDCVEGEEKQKEIAKTPRQEEGENYVTKF